MVLMVLMSRCAVVCGLRLTLTETELGQPYQHTDVTLVNVHAGNRGDELFHLDPNLCW
jgi:hypothetical protein